MYKLNECTRLHFFFTVRFLILSTIEYSETHLFSYDCSPYITFIYIRSRLLQSNLQLKNVITNLYYISLFRYLPNYGLYYYYKQNRKYKSTFKRMLYERNIMYFYNILHILFRHIIILLNEIVQYNCIIYYDFL